MLSRYVSRYSDWAPFVLRVTLGVIMAVHGQAKLFGANGVAGVAGFFGGLGIPAAAFFAWSVTLLELAGGIALVAGLFTRYVSALLSVQFAYIVVMAAFAGKIKPSFSGGWEYDLLILAVAVALLLVGSGKRLSLERILFKKEY